MDQQIWLYHANYPKGKLFNLSEVDESKEQMVKDGWVDTPAKLTKSTKTKEKEQPADPVMSTEELVQKVKSLGYIVLTEDDLREKIKEALKEKLDFSEMETPYTLFQRFTKKPTDLTKEELVTLGAEFDLKLKMTMKESTMIGHINQVLEDLKTDPE